MGRFQRRSLVLFRRGRRRKVCSQQFLSPGTWTHPSSVSHPDPVFSFVSGTNLTRVCAEQLSGLLSVSPGELHHRTRQMSWERDRVCWSGNITYTPSNLFIFIFTVFTESI